MPREHVEVRLQEMELEGLMAANAYAWTTHDGKTVDQITKAALEVAEKRLGYALTVVQGYNPGGVAASGGTHDGGGVVDLAPWDWQRKVRVLRSIGFAAWYRPELWRNGQRIWGAHIHAVLVGHERLSPQAAAQVIDYLEGRDGLADKGPDTGPRKWVGVRFEYPPRRRTPRITAVLVAQTPAERTEALQALAESTAKRKARRAARQWLTAQRNIKAARETLKELEVR